MIAKPTELRRRIIFSSSVTVIPTISLYDYTPREISAAWFNDEDMNGITNRCFKLLAKMESGLPSSGKKYCIRGLEGHTMLGSISKRKNRSAATDAVLVEQSKQCNEDRVDEHAISDAYRRTTASCQLWAQVVGKRDQEAAEAIHYPDDDNENTNTTTSLPVRPNQTNLFRIPKSKNISKARSLPEPSGARAAWF